MSKRKGKPAKPATGWIKAIGASVTTWEVTLTEEQALGLLSAGAARLDGELFGAKPRYGFCQVDRPLDLDFEAIPWVEEMAGEVAIWGLRSDVKKGLPKKRLAAEALKQAWKQAEESGGGPATVAETDEIYDHLEAEWYRKAKPTTDVIPVTWHPTTDRLVLHSRSSKAVEALGNLLGDTDRVTTDLRDAWDELEGRDLGATNLLTSALDGEEPANIGSEFMLWVLAKTARGSATVEIGGAPVTIRPGSSCKLKRTDSDGDPVTCSLGGGDHSAMRAALASGALPVALELVIEPEPGGGEYVARLGLQGLSGLTLPAELKIKDGPAAALIERLQLAEGIDPVLRGIAGAFVADRSGPDWGQRMNALRREIGMDIAAKYGAITLKDGTVQGFLFANMLPGAS